MYDSESCERSDYFTDYRVGASMLNVKGRALVLFSSLVSMSGDVYTVLERRKNVNILLTSCRIALRNVE